MALVQVSNEKTFDGTHEKAQNLQISQMRALESGRWLLRSARTGVSAIIDAKGRVAAQVPEEQSYMLADMVQPMTGMTPYARWGNGAIVSLALVTALLCVYGKRRAGPRRLHHDADIRVDIHAHRL